MSYAKFAARTNPRLANPATYRRKILDMSKDLRRGDRVKFYPTSINLFGTFHRYERNEVTTYVYILWDSHTDPMLHNLDHFTVVGDTGIEPVTTRV